MHPPDDFHWYTQVKKAWPRPAGVLTVSMLAWLLTLPFLIFANAAGASQGFEVPRALSGSVTTDGGSLSDDQHNAQDHSASVEAFLELENRVAELNVFLRVGLASQSIPFWLLGDLGREVGLTGEPSKADGDTIEEGKLMHDELYDLMEAYAHLNILGKFRKQAALPR